MYRAIKSEIVESAREKISNKLRSVSYNKSKTVILYVCIVNMFHVPATRLEDNNAQKKQATS